MYWYKLKRTTIATLLGGFLLLSGLQACRPDKTQSNGTLKYFDIAGYFKADTARLTKSNPRVEKTVTHNGVTESKTIQIPNWGQEFNLFILSDINRPAWKNSYSVLNTDSLIIYKAKTPDLRTTEVMIKKEGDNVKWIVIFNHTKNLLYETHEKLSYFPDSVYQIEKSQQVRLMGKNLYRIKGVLKK
jgi:hypothetical protein